MRPATFTEPLVTATNFGCGTVFKLPSPDGITVLHSFTGPDGCDPESTLTYSNGTLVGTTRGGGVKGQGTVFSLDTDGDSFQSISFIGKTGIQPLSAVTPWGYGTAYSGGGKGQGIIYMLYPWQGLDPQTQLQPDRRSRLRSHGRLAHAECWWCANHLWNQH